MYDNSRLKPLLQAAPTGCTHKQVRRRDVSPESVFLARPCAPYSHEHGIKQVERDAVANFADECGADSSFRGRMCALVECLKLFCLRLGAGHQFGRIDHGVEKAGTLCGLFSRRGKLPG